MSMSMYVTFVSCSNDKHAIKSHHFTHIVIDNSMTTLP